MRKALEKLLDTVECAIKSGDWKVDGACDPDSAILSAKKALAQPEQEPKCNPHPKAPHGFNRNASHANDRYTCECEGWDAYDADYQAGVTAGIEASMGQEPPQRKPLTEWIDPNDKTQERFLPNIGEPVLFCHCGKTYYGQHNGGSFQLGYGVTKKYFNTWECRWMRLPAAHGIKE